MGIWLLSGFIVGFIFFIFDYFDARTDYSLTFNRKFKMIIRLALWTMGGFFSVFVGIICLIYQFAEWISSD